MKILQFLTILTLENIKTSANDIEDITLERLLTYFKYEVCLAKVRFWRSFSNITRVFTLKIIYQRLLQGVDKKICNNVDTFLKSDCLKRADPGPCAAFRQFYGYDEQTDTCKEFHFGGCRGNRNKEWIDKID